ncbi:hypothetical protein UJ101_02663 [Flavobacteriaceae bacterium UJ101]|nr:hypothetical protein UJ101_02663 [Flavobacteriaceae bacterium UJ101]
MKKVVFTLLALSSTMVFSQEKTSITSQELRDEIKNEVKEELKNELRAELEAELREDLIKEAKASISKEDFLSRAKDLISSRVKLSGKGLLRLYEQDWNQRRLSYLDASGNPVTTDGVNAPRDTNGNIYGTQRTTDPDRYWSRYNFYLNIDVKFNEMFALHSRIRTGHKQYSFVTFGGQTQERFGIMLDQFYLDIKKGNYRSKIGRQGAIWNNQKGSQFDIPTHDGITVGANYDLGSNLNFDIEGAYYDEYYRNNTSLEKHGKMYGYELNLKGGGERTSFGLHQGWIFANHLPTRYQNNADDTSGVKYHDGDLAADYSIFTSGGKLTFKKLKNLTFQADYYHNFKNYDTNPVSDLIFDANGVNTFDGATYVDANGATQEVAYDASTAPDFTDQKNGFVGTVSVGGMSKPKDWYLGISYLYMEKYAAMDYFAQYDYARWASSNIKGPEFKAGYRINKFMKMQGRLFLTEEIKGLQGADPSYTRSGNRFRLDLNFNF